MIVLTDIGGDPGDQQSMVRLLSYANEFEIEGLIASAAGIPGELKENVLRPGLIRQIEGRGSIRRAGHSIRRRVRRPRRRPPVVSLVYLFCGRHL
ncbi:MAG: DUF1593 domain-containing protein [Bryobacterales bacterium]|nr:DUF1593 domain-containing protein [Bryobacterales bacterium]